MTGRAPGPPRCGVCATRPRCLMGELGPRAASDIEPHITVRRFHRGDVLSEQGAVSGTTRSIKVGSAVVVRSVVTGEHKPVALIGRGAPIGLLGYFGIANQTGTVAAGAVHACDIPHEAVRVAARSEPWIQRRVTELAAGAAGNLAEWSAAVREPGTVNQVAHVLLLLKRMQGNAVVELPQHRDLADLLGARRETVARALGTLEAEGAVCAVDRRHYEIDAGRLRARLAG